MSYSLTRRQAIVQATALAASASSLSSIAPAAIPSTNTCTLGMGTYAMPSLKTERAIDIVAQTGFDSIEITVKPDWDSAPERMPKSRRKAVQQQLAKHGLILTSLMENLRPARNDQQHQRDLQRLEKVLELAHDLQGGSTPLVQTVLGGGNWEKDRTLIRDRVGDWLEIAQKSKVVLAVKPHRGHVMSTPDEAVWLIKQLGNPSGLRMVYDYSHFAFREMPLNETIKTSLPYTAHIAVKDAVRQDNRTVFELPGKAGTIDYAQLIAGFYQGGYRRDICCEVSSMVSRQKGYDPVAAAKICYANLSKAFKQAEVPRPA